MKELRKWGRVHGAWSFIAYLAGMFLGMWVVHLHGVSAWIRWPAAAVAILGGAYGVLYLAWRFSADGYKRSR